MKVIKVTQNDFDGICNVEFTRYQVMYAQQPHKIENFKSMLRKRIHIAKDWMWVLKENSQILGVITAQPTKRQNILDFSSWQAETDNGTLQRTFELDGDKVYAVNLDVLHQGTARHGQYMLLSEVYKQMAINGIKTFYYESRLPGFRKYIKETMGLEKWDSMSDNQKTAQISKYVALRVVINGEEVHYDRLLRFMSTIEGEITKVLLNAFDDPESLNCGVLIVDNRISTGFRNAIRKYSKDPKDYQNQGLMLKSVISLHRAVLKDNGYLNLSADAVLRQERLYPADKILYKLQQAILAPPHPDFSELTDNQLYFQFVFHLQQVIGPDKIDHHLREIFEDHCEMLKSQKSLKHMNLWIERGRPTGKQPARWNPDDFILNQAEPFYGFSSWSDFFLRRIKPQSRPVDQSSEIVCTPCQCFPVSTPMQPFKHIQAKDKFWLKNGKYSLQDMLNAKQLKNPDLINDFVGGTIFQGYLDYWCYHRWHAPVDGIVQDIYTIPGKFLMLKPDTEKPNVDAFVAQQPFLSCVATRQVLVFKADNLQIGRVILIAISMAEVSTCVSTVAVGQAVKKGQEIGHFELGSSFCLLFEKNCAPDFFTESFYSEFQGTSQSKLLKVNSPLCKVKSREARPKL